MGETLEATAERIVMVVGDILRHNPTNIKGAEQAVINQLRFLNPKWDSKTADAETARILLGESRKRRQGKVGVLEVDKKGKKVQV